MQVGIMAAVVVVAALVTLTTVDVALGFIFFVKRFLDAVTNAVIDKLDASVAFAADVEIRFLAKTLACGKNDKSTVATMRTM